MAFTIIRHNVLHNQVTTQQIQVTGNSLDIGRGTDNGLWLDDLHIALRHAVIEYVDGRYVIKDLESRSGTSVNHRAVRMRPLADGDVVHIGSYNLRIHVPAQDGPLTIEALREGAEAITEGTASILARYRLAESFFTKRRLTVWGLGLVIGGTII
jgi:pSer/pThr/pTyr-binding forkhead associated (FHA) protein